MFSDSSSNWGLVLVCIFTALLCLVPRVGAQRWGVGNLAEGPVSFSVDYASFYDPQSGTPWLEVFYKVANDHLQFVKEKGGYRASFRALCVVYDRKGRQVTGDELSKTSWVVSYDETNSRSRYARGQFRFALAAGAYKIRVWIEGQHSTELVSMDSEAMVPSFESSSLMLSDLLLVDELRSAQDQEQEYIKNNLLLVPSVSRSYSDLSPQLSFYFEIYDLATNEPRRAFYKMILQVVDADGHVVVVDSGQVFKRPPLSFGRRVFDVTALKEEGSYVLRLQITDPKTGRTAQREKSFSVRWSNLGLVDSNYEEAIELLRYIAPEDEYKKLKAAEGEERKKAWLDFWAKRDPTPGTPENEMKEEYYRRIEYANEHFSVVGPGWKSDRGRVYIIYGHPDEIEHHPMEIGLKPYEIWHYYSSNHHFYFVDESGFGDYRLFRWR